MKQAIINYQKKSKDNRTMIIGLIVAAIMAPFILMSFASQIVGFFIPNEEAYGQLEQVAIRFAEEKSMEVLQDSCIADYTLKSDNDSIVLWLFGHTCERVNVNLTLDYNIESISRPYENILLKCFLPVYAICVYIWIFCGLGLFIRPVVDKILEKVIAKQKTSAC